MKIFGDVKRGAKRFYSKYPKITVYGGIGAGVLLAGGIAYAATRPKKNSIASVILASTAYVPYAMTVRGSLELAALLPRLEKMSQLLKSGSFVFMDAKAFRSIYTHGGVRVLDLIPRMFYNRENKFTTDELGDHAHCQTWNASVVQLGNDWASPFFNTVYREPDIVKIINGKEVHYAGNPIASDDPRFIQMAYAAMEANIKNAMDNGDLVGALETLKKFGIDFGLESNLTSMYMFPVPTWTRDVLIRFAKDMLNLDAVKKKLSEAKITLPTSDPQGKVYSTIGAMLIAGLIDTFESHDAKVNPCIREVTPELVFEMFMVTIGTVIGLAIGPALSALSVAIKFATTINKLAELSK
jgi:hypothetical protein